MELGVQVFEDTPDQTFEGIDLLDPTKIVPEELAPVQPIGELTLNATPTNFFAETEQVAFHVGHLVPGIDVTDDPLLQTRLFSYVDTQLTRLGGPNFNQIPINRTHAPVNDMLRDGFHQQAVHGGVAPYKPNSLDGGCPFVAGDAEGAFLDVPQAIAAKATKVRANPASFEDHFSQTRLFWRSLSPVEQDHVVSAYAFELGKCWDSTIRLRQVTALGRVDAGLAERVAARLGLQAPPADLQVEDDLDPSPALSQVGDEWPVEGRQVGIIVGPDSDPDEVEALTTALRTARVTPLLVAPVGGPVWPDRTEVAHRTLHTTRSVEFDAVVLTAVLPPAGDEPVVDATVPEADPRLTLLVEEALRHAKPVAFTGTATPDVLGVDAGSPGVLTASAADLPTALVAAMARHRMWERVGSTG